MFRAFTLILATFSLSACGGGGGGGTSGGGGGGAKPPTPPIIVVAPPQGSMSDLALFADAPGTSVDLTVISLDANAASILRETGTLTRPDTITGTRLAGTVTDLATGAHALNAGGSATLLNQIDGAEAFLFRFDATEGVGGLATATAALPSGTTTYTGAGRMQVIGDGLTYVLNGAATVSADFAGGGASIAFAGMDGIRQTAGTTTAVSGLTASITGAALTNGALSGGTLSLDAALPQPGTGTLAHEGQIFGATGTEAGGVFDQSEADFRALGSYIAK